ncbi:MULTISPECIES: LysM peptidoglycan-binding domain-containing protein [Paenarthrobacter]|uniref:LysM peptidoglycan-binding domain-containing protein n=1 Tax=Paenarthrobacter TaxID=1742992 RepID=UPI0023659731|nr:MULTISPECIES: LysM domain-containing protein [Paenarthrobacter]MDD7835598.1 LysM domain-containing protein [Paenarthrobacter sp. AB444]MDP9936262.1 LysM repeat protein [Paenarthrobacter nicotinovorans]
MNMNDVELQTSLNKNSGVGRQPPFSKSKLMIAGAVLAILALIPVIFGVVNWAANPTGTDQTVSNQHAAAPEAVPSAPASSAAATAQAQDAGAQVAPAAAPAADVPAAVPAAEPAAAPAPAAEAAPVAEPAPPAAPAGDPNLYTVVSGDTVGSIAARFGVDVNAMLAANGLSAYSVIVPGQVLKLTGPPVAPVAAAAPVQAPVAQAPVAAAPAAPAVVAAPAPAPAPAVRTIYVAGAGGQSLVDACIGPINYTPTNAYALFITEHDFCGGWARFSGIGVGETVSIPGYGTFTATGRGQVPNPGTTNDVAAVFGGFPAVVLQTCIPGTNQMLVIALN